MRLRNSYDQDMSIRMDRDNYEFLSAHDCGRAERFVEAVRDLVTRGRILLAVEKYKKGESLPGQGVRKWPTARGQMITLLEESECGAGSTGKTIAKVLANLAKLVRNYPLGLLDNLPFFNG